MKISKYPFLFLFILLFIYSSCAGPKKTEMDVTQVRKAVDEANQKFIDASLKGDAAAAAVLCTDDTFLLPPNSKMIQGKQATEEYWRATWAQLKITDFKMTIVDLYGNEDLVYEVGNYIIKFQIGEKEGIEEGKYVVIWKHMADKTWKKHVDIWNSSMPTQ
jgi:ketosteroid isomerase-like protein